MYLVGYAHRGSRHLIQHVVENPPDFIDVAAIAGPPPNDDWVPYFYFNLDEMHRNPKYSCSCEGDPSATWHSFSIIA